jgi:amino acid transporter
MRLRELLFGKPLRTEEEQEEQIGVAAGIPVLGLDALASASYGPEAALTILLPLGVMAPAAFVPIAACILAVLGAVFFSYRQTIPAYPSGGGSFTVARTNLGPRAGLLAASALSMDYILNVAVAISAGVGALVSAFPPLLPYTLPLCLGVLGMLALINLRGIRTAGIVFMFPTYLFLVCLGTALIWGILKSITHAGAAFSAPGSPVPAPPLSFSIGAWLFLRAFASGCTALTGVEAVSNAVPIFKKPTIKNAVTTLTWIIVILALFIGGIAFAARGFGITALPPGQPGYQSVVSQLVAAVFGRGAFYFLTMGAVLAVLALSANTSFADFPRVCRALALDEFLPAEFAHRGSRLVYTTGIILLTFLSGILLLVMGGITDRLIPLFAIGAFLAFTLSQLGMVVYWRRHRGPGWKRALLINFAGASATGATLIVIMVSKFIEGAWIIILLIPLLILLFSRIRHHHDQLSRDTSEDGPADLASINDPIVVLPLKRLDRVARKALRLAVTLSRDVRVVQVLAEELKTENLTDSWNDLVQQPARRHGIPAPRLTVVTSAYREFFGPFLDYLKRLGVENPDRAIAVLVPEVVEQGWLPMIFKSRAALLKRLLILKGGPRIIIITIPWHPSRGRQNVTAAKGGPFLGEVIQDDVPHSPVTSVKQL